jgi:multicomponent K+:H+ antiporter subunit E
MKRLLPYPKMAASLVVMWLLLNQSTAPAHVLLGAVVAMFATWTMAALKIAGPRVRMTMAIPCLLGAVVGDIIRSNVAVAAIILLRRTQPASGFVRIPLDTNNLYCLAGLACIITATPGTLWMEHDSRRNVLLLHVLDLADEEYWVKFIKHRYERLLMEIFV